MAKIDQIKETLSTLRMLFTIMSAIFLAVGSGLVGMYKVDMVNNIFYLGLYVEYAIFVIILVIGLIINKKVMDIENI